MELICTVVMVLLLTLLDVDTWYLQYNYTWVNFVDDTTNLPLDGGEIVILPNNPISPYWNSCSFTDCNGVLNGTALYIYDVITHNVMFINDTNNLNLSPTQILVLLPQILECQCQINGVVNGLKWLMIVEYVNLL